jgi:hypothetical protein
MVFGSTKERSLDVPESVDIAKTSLFADISKTLGKVGPASTALEGVSSAFTIAYYAAKFASGGVTGPSVGETEILNGVKAINEGI